MTILDHPSHQLRKRGYAPHYNPVNLALFQPEIHNSTRELVNVSSLISLELSASNGITKLLSAAGSNFPMAVDTLLLFRHYFIDINCIHLFDYRAGSLNAWSQHILQGGPPDELSRSISDFPKRGLLVCCCLVCELRGLTDR